MKRFIIPVLLLFCACSRVFPDERAVFSVQVENAWETPASKSTLTQADIENRITCASFAVYRGGSLFLTKHSTSAQVSVSLENKEDYTIYALVNMGDQRSSFPAFEADLSQMSWALPSYSEMNTTGIPMAGMASYTGGAVTVPVKRLLAKVTAQLHVTWPDGKITRALIGNMNGTLRPFGASAIESAADVFNLSVEAETLTSPSATASLVFYVPENMQGDVSGIGSSEDKSPEGSVEVNGKAEKLSYLQVEVSGNGLYQGNMVYRSFLGNSSTGNFDIERDCAYVWDISYYENKLSKEEWKYDSSGLQDLRTLSIQSPIFVFSGRSVSISDYLSSNMPLNTIGWSISMRSSSYTFVDEILNASDVSGDSFTVDSGLHTDDYANGILSVFPLNNPVSGLCNTAKVYVADQAIEWKNTLYGSNYYLFPGRSTDAEVNYSLTYFDQEENAWQAPVRKGQGGLEWNWTQSPASGVTSLYLGDNGNEYEQIRYSAAANTLPGDYNLVAETQGGASDQANLHVCDTRYIKWVDRSGSVPATGVSFIAYRYLAENKIIIFLPYGSLYAIANGRFSLSNSPFCFIAGDRSADIEDLDSSLSGVPFEGATLLAGNYSDRIGIAYSSNLDTYAMYGQNGTSGRLILSPMVTTKLGTSSTYTVSIFAKNGYNDATRHQIEGRIRVGPGTIRELVIQPAISKVQVGTDIQFTASLYTFRVVDNELITETVTTPASSTLTWDGAPDGLFTASTPGNYRITCTHSSGATAYADIEVTSSDIEVSGSWDNEGSTTLD